jgi:hypothetical protein
MALRLRDYRSLIRALPCNQQAGLTRRKTWCDKAQCPQEILKFFDGREEFMISRQDVFQEAARKPFNPGGNRRAKGAHIGE